MKLAQPKSPNRCDAFFSIVLAYLVLPNLLFLLTWVRPWIGVPAVIAVVFCLVFLIWQSRLWEPRQGLDRRNLIFVLALAFFWTLLAGAGGFVPQCSDYTKHNLLFHDLIHMDWPVIYSLPGGGHSYLCYGVGYYLAPALGARILGDAAMPVLSFLWTFCGIALFFYWVAASARRPKTTLLICLLFAVTGSAFYIVKAAVPFAMHDGSLPTKLTHLGLYHSYYDTFTKLQFQPQHAMAAWLGAVVLYDLLWLKKNPGGALFVWSTCLCWSPMTCIGLLLVPLAALRHISWRAYFSAVNLVGGGALVLIMGVYFQGHLHLAENGPIWKFTSGWDWLPFYLVFLVLELTPVLFIFLIDLKYHVLGELRPLFLVAAGLLVLLPLYKIGYFSDLRLEASTPALLFAAFAAAICLQSEVFSFKRPLFILLAGSLLAGAVYPISRPWVNLMTNRHDFSYANILRTRGFRNISEYKEPGYDPAAQYLGRDDSLAARRLLR